jgi:hypothetical protein
MVLFGTVAFESSNAKSTNFTAKLMLSSSKSPNSRILLSQQPRMKHNKPGQAFCLLQSMMRLFIQTASPELFVYKVRWTSPKLC